MNKIPFGIDEDGNWQTADSVPNGLNCKCICPACELPLVAKQGQSVTWHFAHHLTNPILERGNRCAESTVHKWAKSVLQSSQGKILHLPRKQEYEVGVKRGEYRCRLVECRIEYWIADANRRVDVFATTQIVRNEWPEQGISMMRKEGNPLIIEICVNNPKDGAYIDDIRKAGVSAIEISISSQDIFDEVAKGRGDSMSAMKRLVLGPRNVNRRWLNHQPSFRAKTI